jgi:short subunit dehydrogenase-like uncharacterized protein
MTYQKLLILGGTGNAGFSIAQHLLNETELSLIISSRDIEKARFTAGELNAHAKDNWSYRATGIALDPNDQNALKSVLNQVDAVIVAAAGIDTAKLVELLIETKTDCIDIRENSDKHRILQYYHSQLIENNIFYLSESGSFPGLPTLLIRYLLTQMPTANHAIANIAIRMDWKKYPFSKTTVKEFAESLQTFQSKVWHNNYWKKINNWRDVAKINFDKNLPAQTCMPMVLPETLTLVEKYPQLQYLNTRITGFNPLVDYLMMPLLQWTTLPLSSVLEWALKRFSKPPFGVYFQAEVSRVENRRELLKISLNHTEGYDLTGKCVTAVILQCLKTDQKTAGLHLQGLWAEPIDFIEQLKQLGIQISFQN